MHTCNYVHDNNEYEHTLESQSGLYVVKLYQHVYVQLLGYPCKEGIIAGLSLRKVGANRMEAPVL